VKKFKSSEINNSIKSKEFYRDWKKELKVEKEKATPIAFDILISSIPIEIKKKDLDTSEKDSEVFINHMKELRVRKL
jgi:RNAse (barnase) inhibitor barstar